MICRAAAYFRLERIEHSIEDYNAALELLDRDLGFTHFWSASVNRAFLLIEGIDDPDGDQVDQAIRQLQEVNELRRYEEGTVPFLTVSWAEARLMMKQERWPSAGAKMQAICTGWRKLDLILELTIASLDLARCYFEQDLMAETIELAGEMFPLFPRFRGDRRAYQALKTFHRAAMEGGLKSTLIVDTREAVQIAKIA